MIVPAGKGRYVVKSESGKRFSKPMGKEAAAARLKQIEYFKYLKSKGK